MKAAQMDLLRQINNDLLHVIAIAENDFMEINSLLKGHYDRMGTSNGETALLIGELQYMDTFRQRVQHLIMVNRYVSEQHTSLNFKESFFHLHAFQSMTIEMDLLRSIGFIHESIKRLESDKQEVSSRFSDNTYFRNIPEIKRVLQKTIEVLGTAGGDIRFLPVPPLTREQAYMLSNVYTMESERIVLNWFLSAMPTGTWENLFQDYHQAVHSGTTEDTQLF